MTQSSVCAGGVLLSVLGELSSAGLSDSKGGEGSGFQWYGCSGVLSVLYFFIC